MIWPRRLRFGWTGARAPEPGVVAADELRAWMAAGDTLLVDVREAEEHARRAIPGAICLPLSRFPDQLPCDGPVRRVVFHCQSGRRTRAAARRLAASTTLPAFALADGMDGWDRQDAQAGVGEGVGWAGRHMP